MTGVERRAAEVAHLAFRAKSARMAYEFLANHPAPDGSMTYISAEDARTLRDSKKGGWA
jgi:hypothetical protein